MKCCKGKIWDAEEFNNSTIRTHLSVRSGILSEAPRVHVSWLNTYCKMQVEWFFFQILIFESKSQRCRFKSPMKESQELCVCFCFFKVPRWLSDATRRRNNWAWQRVGGEQNSDRNSCSEGPEEEHVLPARCKSTAQQKHLWKLCRNAESQAHPRPKEIETKF